MIAGVASVTRGSTIVPNTDPAEHDGPHDGVPLCSAVVMVVQPKIIALFRSISTWLLWFMGILERYFAYLHKKNVHVDFLGTRFLGEDGCHVLVKGRCRWLFPLRQTNWHELDRSQEVVPTVGVPRIPGEGL